MARFVVRNLEEQVRERLPRRPERHGRSMEDEVLAILRGAANKGNRFPIELGSGTAARFATIGLTQDLPELRGQPPMPAALGSRTLKST
jgi:plasmid stability protein